MSERHGICQSDQHLEQAGSPSPGLNLSVDRSCSPLPTHLYDDRVAIVADPGSAAYPSFPYAATSPYAEFKQAAADGRPNRVFDAVRQALIDLKLDADRIGTAEWNPFSSFIEPGQTVLLKPNWVRDYNPIDASTDSLITHTSVIRAVIDYVTLALDGRGVVILADAPLQSCNFDHLVGVGKVRQLLDSLGQRHPNIAFRLIDLRKTIHTQRTLKETLRGDSFQTIRAGAVDGYTLVKLGGQSLLTDLDDRFLRFRVTHYDHNLMHEHHNREVNEYLVGSPILEADVIINLPKMKTHLKAGITGALKNLIGINGHKEFLPHHIDRSFLEGGDQYIFPSRIKRAYNRVYDRYWSEHRLQSRWTNAWQTLCLKIYARLARTFGSDDLFDGGWFGNETIPRTTIDLNHILYFFNLRTGRMEDKPVRKVFHLIDGIIAGEKDGPLQPSAKSAGVIIAGFNPLLTDLAMAQLIGLQAHRIKTIFYGFYHKKSRLWRDVPDRLDRITVMYNGRLTPVGDLPNLDFALPRHWRALSAKAATR